MKSFQKKDNAANRSSYVGSIYNKGEKFEKNDVLNSINEKWSNLHKNGYIHIHDLDAYNLTYNCLTFDLLKSFPYKRFESLNEEYKIVLVFDFLKELFEQIGNEQSGGMSIANFDIELATIFSNLNVNFKNHINVFKTSIRSLIIWNNNNHTRMGQTSYYVSFNIGLGTSEFERFITSTLLDEFENSGHSIFKPNIIFKISSGFNRDCKDINFDLLQKSLKCTSKKMIPTYLLCDSISNKNYDPKKLAIVGCRTRVVDDLYGESTSIGRGNVVNVSINLPKLAFEINEKNFNSNVNEKFELFKRKWLDIACDVKNLLVHRFFTICKLNKNSFSANQTYSLWKEWEYHDNLYEVFKHGTLSIGFIGLFETVNILANKNYWDDKEIYNLSLKIVHFMRNYTNFLTKKYKLNFSLLGTSGELISGRFLEIDKQIWPQYKNIFNKGFYTNSFHVSVNSGLPAFEKIRIEGPFHAFTNGGSITYVELKEAPIGNSEGLNELVEIAIDSGVQYMGFNFPKDLCNNCGKEGIFDQCFNCDSFDILRVRRVSGYLEIQDYFTDGKYNESKKRTSN